MSDNEYLAQIMKRIEFPDEAAEFLAKEWGEVCGGPIGKQILEGCDEYESSEKPDFDLILDKISVVSEKENRKPSTEHMLFFLLLSRHLREKYKKLNYSDEIFFDTVQDLKWKLLECMANDGCWGIICSGWECGFYVPDRFAIGRLQYELWNHPKRYSAHGITVQPGSIVLAMHIPSSGPLTPELCMDSFKKAHAFYKDFFPSGITVFTVGSWLLFPKHREFLPENSNILKFMDFFDIYDFHEEEPGERNDMWRIFGKDWNLPAEQLPRDTGLRRAYADWLQKGGTVGYADGIFFFDGEKIIR